MLALFRRHLNSWVARAFFLLLIGTFVLWGVGDVFRNMGGDDGSIANIGGTKIPLDQAQDAYRRQLAQLTRMFGGKIDPTPQMKRGVAAQAVEQLVTQASMNNAVTALGLGTSDDALRQAVYDIPNFQGPNGQFDRARFDEIIRNNGMTEPRFMALVRQDVMQRELTGAARAGIAAPNVLTRAVYAFQNEKRVADAVSLPFAASPPPEAPSELALTRWYENHKTLYSTPEYRRIKAVVLAPDTVIRDLQVTEDELKAAYTARIADFKKPEKRSLQVFLLQDEAKAKDIQQKWAAGADPATLADEAGGPPVALEDATAAEIPAPELAAAAFAATPDTVPPPVHSALGWHVLKVTKVTPGTDLSFEAAHDQLRTQVLADKAADLIYDRAGKLQDLLTGGTPLDEMPTDLGLAAITGTLDDHGNTPEGTAAPIPGPPSLATTLAQTAFQMKKGDPARFVEAPAEANGAQSYFAVEVDDVTPPAAKPMADVMDAVRADFTRDAVRHEAETRAADILAAVKSGKSLADAAPGLAVTRLPGTGRSTGAPGVPTQLVEPMFGLAVGEPTMVETPEGFTVAVLAQIDDPNPDTDAIGFGQVREQLTKSLGDDVQATLITALRARANPKVNAAAIDQIVAAE